MLEGEPGQLQNDKEIGKGEEREDSVNFTRHSKATYQTYSKIVGSENPQDPVDPEHQVIPDVSEKGIELARAEAEKFFDTLDSQKDVLFFASSTEVRALETAEIYKKVAEEKGFEILKPEHVRSGVAERIGEGDIRAVHALSLDIPNTLLSTVFNPETHLTPINWDAVDAETKEKWEKARAIINADDRGSWGANFFHHSVEIKQLFPELEDTKEVYETIFKKLTRLAEFGLKKAQTSGLEKNVKIMAFGHENYMGYALNKYFDDNEIKNCETVTVKIEGDRTFIERRGEEALM